MKAKRESLIIAGIAIGMALILVVSSFVVTLCQARKSVFDEDLVLLNSEDMMVEEKESEDSPYMSLVGNVVKSDENVVELLRTKKSSPKISWKFSSKNIRKGNKFKVQLTIKNVPKNFKLYWEDIGTSKIKIIDIYGSNGKYTIECKASKTGKGIIKYMPTGDYVKVNIKKQVATVSKTKAVWSIPNKNIVNGESFDAVLTINNASKDFKLYYEDIGTYGIKINNIYGSNGKYTVECQATQVGECIISYIPTGEYKKINVNKKLTPVETTKVSWSVPMAPIYEGDTFNVNLEIKNVPEDFKLYWEDISTSGITILSIYRYNDKYIIECRADQVGDKIIKYNPTGDYVDVYINQRYIPVQTLKANFSNTTSTICKDEIFYINLDIQNAQGDFKLRWEDLGTIGINITNIFGSNGIYILECKGTEVGNGVIKYIPTGDFININISPKNEPVMSGVWEAPAYIQKGSYFYAQLTVLNAPENYSVNLNEVATYGIYITDFKAEGNKCTLTCLATESGNLTMQFLSTGENITIISY